MLLAGIDIGGTKMEVSLFNVGKNLSAKQFDLFINDSHLEAEKLLSKRAPTDRHLGYRKVVANLASLIKDTVAASGHELNQLNSIGIGLPGIIDPVSGMMKNGNTGIFINQDLAGDLKLALEADCRIMIANDANCFALAEAIAGAGVKYQQETGIPIKNHVGLGVIIGTGCGGGIIIGGRMVTGRNGASGEIGHYTLIKDGHPTVPFRSCP
jgi:fructokinase